MSEDSAKSFEEVREYEYRQVEERRKQLHSANPDKSSWGMPPESQPLQADLVGLAFSGGGIRSATFNLGILQALGRLKLLTRIDYLSSVSGGGFIGGWLAAWIQRAAGPISGATPQEKAAEAVRKVEGFLDPRTDRVLAVSRGLGDLGLDGPVPLGDMDAEPETVHHLRAHSRYLSPRAGLFSLDTWSLLAIYFRNLFVTSLITAPLALGLAAFCWWVAALFTYWPAGSAAWFPWVLFIVFVALAFAAEALFRERFSAASEAGRATLQNRHASGLDRSKFTPGHWFVLTAALVAFSLLGTLIAGPHPHSGIDSSGVRSRAPELLRVPLHGDQKFLPEWMPNAASETLGWVLMPSSDYMNDYVRGAIIFAALGLLGGVIGLYRGRWLLGMSIVLAAVALLAVNLPLAGLLMLAAIVIVIFMYPDYREHKIKHLLLTVLHGALLGLLFVALINNFLFLDGHNHPLLFATLGPPLFVIAVVVAGFVETAVANRIFNEYEREWRSRLGGWLLMCAFAWLGIFVSVVYLPRWLAELSGIAGQNFSTQWMAVVGWLATTGFGLFAARKARARSSGFATRVFVRFVPVIFLVGLLALASGASLWLSKCLPEWTHVESDKPECVKLVVVHLNDLYEIDAVDGGNAGGLARVSGLRRDLAKQYDGHVLTLVAGDFLSPSPSGSLKADGGEPFNGRQMVSALRKAGVDHFVLGQHEFDYDEGVFKARLREMTQPGPKFAGEHPVTPLISSNVVDRQGKPLDGVPPTVVRTIRDRNGNTILRVGIIGLTMKSTVKGEYASMTDPVKAAQDQIAAWKGDKTAGKPDVIIALTHQPLEDDAKLAKECPGIDLIAGGHEHANSRRDGTATIPPIFRADANARSAYVHEIVFDPVSKKASVKSRLVPLAGGKPAADAEVQHLVDCYMKKVYHAVDNEGFDEPSRELMTLDVWLNGRNADVRDKKGTALTNLIGQSMLESLKKSKIAEIAADAAKGGPNCVALFGAGAIQIDDYIGPGPLRTYDLLRVLPKKEDLHGICLCGSDLSQALKLILDDPKAGGNGVRTWNVEQKGDKWQISKVDIDPLKFYYVAVDSDLRDAPLQKGKDKEFKLSAKERNKGETKIDDWRKSIVANFKNKDFARKINSSGDPAPIVFDTCMDSPPLPIGACDRPKSTDTWRLFVLLGLLLLWAFVAVVFVPATQFSLHSLWLNRITRGYLGASLKDLTRTRGGAAGLCPGNPRQPNDFTGFDPNDDFPLSELRTDDLPPPKDRTPYLGPYPIFNTTLNLVAGEELAYQDRKGASFSLTPAYCGSVETGYSMLGTGSIDNLWNLSLGRAIAVSGAAVDPNMQNYQSGQLTAFLAILNIRMGWWIEKPNPRWTAKPPGSEFGLAGWPYLKELAGQTNTEGKYVHLTDGGHFENTGVYELIRRKCRHIIVVDAAEDPSYASENLANLIRLVRTDFGIPIELDTTPLRKDDNGISRWHCAVGAIRYDEVDPSGVTGTLLFIRPSLTGDEDSDLKNYAATNPPFPHHGTADQFFDEAQFESYRQLGFHIGMEVLGGARQEVGEPPRPRRRNDGPPPPDHGPGSRNPPPDPPSPPPNDDSYRAYTRLFFAALRRVWSPLPDGLGEAYLETCRDYLQATADLRDGEPSNPRDGGPAAPEPRGDLRRVSRSLFAEAANLPAPKPRILNYKVPGVDTPPYYTDLHEVEYLLQIMEIAWLENDLDRFGAHPKNRGWMNVFRRWSSSGAFHRYWPVLRSQYSREFVRFCSAALNLAEPPVKWCRIGHPRSPTWNKVLEDFGIEFQREWAESLRDVCGIEKYEDQLQYVHRAVEHSRIHGRYVAWVITTGRCGEQPGELDEAEWNRAPKENDVIYDPYHAPGQAPRVYLPLGLVVAFRPEAMTHSLHSGQMAPVENYEKEWDLLVWIRGPYRSTGLGRACLPWLLDNPKCSNDPVEMQHGILNELARPSLNPDESVRRLVVRYPQLTGSAGDRLQRRVWTWFFNDNDFVSEYRDPRDPDPDVIKLVREIGKSAAKLTFQKPKGPGRRDASSANRETPPPATNY